MLRTDSYNIYINKNKTVNTTSKNLNDWCVVFFFLWYGMVQGLKNNQGSVSHPPNLYTRT